MFSDESKMEPENCKIEWKIYNLNKHAEYIQQDQFLTSKQFYNPKYPSVKWELRLYPGYNLNEDKSDILIYLNDGGGTYISLVQVGLKESNDYLKAKFVIYTLDEYGDKVYCCSNEKFNFKNQTESVKYKMDDESATLYDPLSLLCEVEFMPYNIKCENKCEDYLNVNTSHRSYINMFKEGIFTDFIIEIEDEKINVHKCVLANNSIVFKTMFEQDGMVEAQNGKIKIVDSSPECFRAMLEYFYSGEIDKKALEKHSYELFAISHKYEVEHLMEISESFMASKIDAANFSECCHYAEVYCSSKLEKLLTSVITSPHDLILLCRYKRIIVISITIF